MLTRKLLSAAVAVGPTLVGTQTYSRAPSTTAIDVGFALSGSVLTPQAGDLVVLAVALGSTVGQLMTPPTDSGYTTIAEILAVDNIRSVLYVGYKIMGSTPDTTFPLPSTINTSNSQAAAVFVWRNVQGLDVTPTTATGANGRQANPPAITPVTSKAVIMAIGAAAHTAAVNFTNTQLNSFVSINQTATRSVTLGAGYVNWTSGAFDPDAFTITGSTTSDAWTAVTLALRPS